MVASFVLVAFDAAFWAHFCFHTSFPFLELFVKNLATFTVWMGDLAAFKADRCAAFALCCLLEHTLLLNVAIASLLRTPLEFRVHIDVYVELEL